MVHGAAGTFDLDITSGTAIECRSAGGTSDAYNVVFTFNNDVSSCGSTNIGTVTAGPNSNQCSVAINVPTGNYVTVQLTGVTDTDNSSDNFSATMGVLVGDTNADKFVDAIDTAQTKSQSGNGVTNSPPNYREDVNTDGFIDAIDVSLVKSKSGEGLPGSVATPAPKSIPARKSKPRKPAGLRNDR